MPLLLCLATMAFGIFWRKQTPIFFIAFWQLLCQRIREKVTPKDTNSQQALLSGGLALLCLLLPLLIILTILYSFAEYQWVFDVLILFVAADFAYVETKTSQSLKALQTNKRQLAKDNLQKIVLRDTKPLSALGIVKGNIESYTLRFSYQVVAVLFCFLLFGSVFALFYRLVYEATLDANFKRMSFRKYATVSYYTTRLISCIPVTLFNAVLLVFIACKAPRSAINVVTNKYFWRLEGISSFITIGTLIDRRIGGPVLIDGIKTRRPRVGGNIDPTIADFYRVKLFLILAAILCLSLVFALRLAVV